MIVIDDNDACPGAAEGGSLCYEAEVLTGYINGWASDGRCVQIEEHLAVCHRCDEMLGQLERAGDTLVRSLRETIADPVENEVVAAQTRLDAPAALTQTGPYELLRPIGHGAMGAVYLARHRQLNKLVAIKMLPPHLIQTPESRLRFEREILCCGQLNHFAIVKATDASLRDDSFFLVMEYIDGLDLSRIAHRTGTMSVANACEVIRQTAIGLQHAHDTGIIHRDVKPSNLMLDRDGRIRILDFGVARFRGADSGTLTHTDQLVGTLDYMAPEQATAPKEVSPRADLFALGATLFRLLTGRPPLMFGSCGSVIEKLQQLTTANALPLAEHCATAPPELCDFVAKMLDRNPSNRPASATAVADVLSGYCKTADLNELLFRAEGAASSNLPILAAGASDDMSAARKIRVTAQLRKPFRLVRSFALLAAAATILVLISRYVLMSEADPDTENGASVASTVATTADDDRKDVLPRILIGVSSFVHFSDTLRSLQKLDERTDSQMDHSLRDYMEFFGIGLEHSRPLLFDVLTEFRQLHYVLHLPMPERSPASREKHNGDAFRQNMEDFGFKSARSESDDVLYSIIERQSAGFGWLRFDENESRCSLVTTAQKDLLPALRSWMSQNCDIADDSVKLVTQKLGSMVPMRLSLMNSTNSTTDQFRRRVAFREHCRLFAAPVQTAGRKNAATAEGVFESRLGTAFRNLYLGEFERLFAESKDAEAELTIDPEMTGAAIDVAAAPIPGSSLEQSLRNTIATPDRFPGLSSADEIGPVLRFHSMLPLDSVRQENLNALLTAAHERLSTFIALSNGQEGMQSEAADVLTAAIVEICRDAIRTGNLNAFAEGIADLDGSFSLVAALAVPDATRLNSMVPHLKSLNPGNEVESVSTLAEEFVCYRIRLSIDDEFITRLLPEINRDMLLCVGKDEAWLGIGPAAAEMLRRKLNTPRKVPTDDTATPAPTKPQLRLTFRPFLWLQRGNEAALSAHADPTSKGSPPGGYPGKEAHSRPHVRLATMFKPADEFAVRLSADSGRQTWRASISQGGMLCMADKIVTFVRDNLQ